MTAEQLTIHARAGKQIGQRILEVAGPLLWSSWPTFLEQIQVEMAPVVILDMTHVHDVDSQGIGALTKIHESFQRQNRRLALAGLTPKVHRMLKITGVLPVLTVFATGAEAEEALVSDAPDPGQVS